MALELGFGVGRQFLYWRPEHGFDPKNCPYKEYGKIYEWLAEMRYARNDARGYGLPVLTEPVTETIAPGLPQWMAAVGRAQERLMGRFPTFGHPNGIPSSQFAVYKPTWDSEGIGWVDSPAPSWPSLAYEQWVMEKDEFFYGPLQEAALPYSAKGLTSPFSYVKPIGPGILLNRVGMGLPILEGLAASSGIPLWKAGGVAGWTTFQDPPGAGAPNAKWQLWNDEKRRFWRFRDDQGNYSGGSLDQVYVAQAPAPTPPSTVAGLYETVLARGVRYPDEPDWSKVDIYVYEGGLCYLETVAKKVYKVIPQ